MIRVDSQMIHSAVVKPALGFSLAKHFKVPEFLSPTNTTGTKGLRRASMSA